MLPAPVISPFLRLLDVLRWRRENDLQCQVMYIVNQRTHTTGNWLPSSAGVSLLSTVVVTMNTNEQSLSGWFCSSVARLIFNIMLTVKGDNFLIFSLSIILCIFNSILPTYLPSTPCLCCHFPESCFLSSVCFGPHGASLGVSIYLLFCTPSFFYAPGFCLL